MNIPDDFREFIRQRLIRRSVAVRFEKVDGELRTISGTLDPNVIPLDQRPKGVKPHNPDVCPIWDIDEKKWKSFCWDKIIAFDSIPYNTVLSNYQRYLNGPF